MPRIPYFLINLFLVLGLFAINTPCFCRDPGLTSLTFVYNNNLPSGTPPMILPNIKSVQGGLIVIVPPNYKFDRGSLTIPGIPVLSSNLKEIKLSYNNITSNTNGSSVVQAIKENVNSKFINGQVLHDIEKNLAIRAGCELTAKISIDFLKKWGVVNCFIPEPTNVTKIACGVGLALKDKAIYNLSKRGVVKGCTYVIKDVTPKIVEVTVKFKKNAENYLQELKYWVSFLNTIEGAQWFMYRIQGNN